MASPGRTVGIDFGTTNSALAVASGGRVEVAQFPFMETVVETFRSILFFESGTRVQPAPKPFAGPAAIERYLEPHDGGRLIQSLKSFAASRTFQQTQIGSRRYKLEELIGILLQRLRVEAERVFGPLGRRAVAGRPIRFVGAETAEDESTALQRIRAAFGHAGFTDVVFEYEPVGAAYAYAQRLQTSKLVLIADFGGGTSDFSIVRFDPGGNRHEILGTSGVPVGGDTFDARIVRRLVSPLLGLGSNYRSMGKPLPVPSSVYRRLESWHHLSFLRSQESLRMLREVRTNADDPAGLDRLIEIVESDLGYHLHRAVQRTKVALSSEETSVFSFTDASLEIHQPVTRRQFEGWIAEDLSQISDCVEGLLKEAQMSPEAVDRVFLTGGSSLVPSVKRLFIQRFGYAKMAAGDEFTSVARGLALRAERI